MGSDPVIKRQKLFMSSPSFLHKTCAPGGSAPRPAIERLNLEKGEEEEEETSGFVLLFVRPR